MSNRLKRRGRGSYLLDGVACPSVTTILKALPMQLTGWAARMTAGMAIDRWDELAELPLSKRYDILTKAPWESRDRSAVRGTRVHALGHGMASGRDVDVPDDLLGPVQAYARFLDRWQIEPVASETPLARTDHRFAGTADLWAKIGKLDSEATFLIDLKTGSGVYESAALQLCAYAHMDLWQPDGPDSEEAPPEVAGGYVAHILPDDVQLIPAYGIESDDMMIAFLYVKQVWHWLQTQDMKSPDRAIGQALILEDVTS